MFLRKNSFLRRHKLLNLRGACFWVVLFPAKILGKARMTNHVAVIALVLFLVLGSSLAYGEDGTGGGTPLTKEEFTAFLVEYKQFKAENETLKQQVAQLRRELTSMKQRDQQAGDVQTTDRRDDLLGELSQKIEDSMDQLLPGTNNFMITGFASTTFQDRQNSDSTFGASIAPIILWKPNDRLLFESELHIMLREEDTEVDLGYAHISYLWNDYLTLGAGKFLLPFGIFNERLHPSWINKLPTAPLTANLVGESGLGFQVRGGAPIGSTKINYIAYIINGPDFGETASNAGRLGFVRNRDNNNNKAVGGRIGFLPIPELEIGYSILCGRVNDSSSLHSGVSTLMQGIDFTYAREFDAIKGRLALHGEAVWVDTDDVIFMGPFPTFTLDNKSNAWWLQAAYRPTKVDLKIGDHFELKNLEFVVRYDQLRRPGAQRLGLDRDQLTIGLDYWILPNAVVKAAYVFDDTHGDSDQDGFFLQMGVGF